ncbi:YSIRK signal domain/LPXTG anchor domain surface protein [Streptococcus minor]|uniref:YSIRK signal domain/LPXTG anchor domain surface protein n=1 Tax=Streptococcus minor TaxID=229549 RepID=UPI000360BABD|nr:YSIRK signal domain/LPXTG anchor domain surface protein [Streptococcus minor]
MFKKIKYGIRKLSVGLASIAIASMFIGVSPSVQARQQTEPSLTTHPSSNRKEANLLSISYADLTAIEQTLIRSERLIEVTEQTYILVYKPSSVSSKESHLPKTSSIEDYNLLLLGIGSLATLLFVVKKRKTTALILLLGASLVSTSSHMMSADEALQFLSLSSVTVPTSNQLTVGDIKNYDYVGYIPLSALPMDSAVRLYANKILKEEGEPRDVQPTPNPPSEPPVVTEAPPTPPVVSEPKDEQPPTPPVVTEAPPAPPAVSEPKDEKPSVPPVVTEAPPAPPAVSEPKDEKPSVPPVVTEAPPAPPSDSKPKDEAPSIPPVVTEAPPVDSEPKDEQPPTPPVVTEEPPKPPVDSETTEDESVSPDDPKLRLETIERVMDSYKNLDYHSEEIYRAAGYRNKRPDYSHLDSLQLQDSFERVKQTLDLVIPMLIDSTPSDMALQEKEEYLLTHKASILLGLAYLDRWYSIPLSEQRLLKDTVLEYVKHSSESLPIWLVTLGNQSIDDPYLPENTAHLFESRFAKVTNAPTIYEFLKQEVAIYQPQTSLNDWFKQTSKAYIAEKQPQSVPMNIEIVERLNQLNLQNFYLPLLTMTEPSIYIIPTATTLTFGDMATYVEESLEQVDSTAYANKMEELKQLIDKHAQYQTDHIDVWYRLAKEGVKKRLMNGSVVVFDSLLQQTTKQWAAKTGPTSTRAVREVLAPSGRYHHRTPNADAFSNGDLIQFSETPILRDDLSQGGSIWTHELVHALEDTVYLGGHGLRPGVGQESYAEGLFQTVRDRNAGSIGLNLYSTLTTDEKKRLSTVNTSPSRFQNSQDLKEYMHRLFDVLYVLDLAEGNALLQTSELGRNHLIGRMIGVKDPDTNHHTDQVVEASDVNKQLRTIDDLIDNQIVIKRHDFRGKVSIIRGPSADRNTYVSVPLFSPMFGLLENPNGASGGYTFRRTAFELLAHKGYEEGMIPYISDQYAAQAKSEGIELSDQYIVSQIFKDDPTINSLSDFKKAMFREREAKVSSLKPITITYENQPVTLQNFSDIEHHMKEALRKDSIRMWRTQGEAAGHVYQLKLAIFKAYFEDTKEFQESIFLSDN